MEKLIGVFKSRKFWAAVISLLVVFGVMQVNDAEQSELVESVLVVVTAVVNAAAYIIGVAIEDAGRARGGRTLD